MDTEKIVDIALDMGAQDVVAQAVREHTVQVKFVNSQSEVAQGWNQDRLEIFLNVDRRITSTTITPRNSREVRDVLRRLISRARVLAPKEDYRGIAQGPFRYRRIKGLYDGDLAELQDYAGITERAIEACLAAGASRAAGILETAVFTRELCTSGGVKAEDTGTSVLLSIRGFGEDGGSGHAVACARELGKFDPEGAGSEAGRIAALADNPREGEKGRFKVLFHPLAFAPILESAGEAASIFAVEAGLSFLRGKLHERVGGENFTLIDDATLEGGLLSRSFDAEGVPTRRNIVVERGVLKMYLHNTSTAKKYGVETTANAGLLSPRPWNILLPPGDVREEDILDELGNGIYVTNVWYTRFQNYTAGDFSTVPRDGMFLVEDGEIKGSLGGVRISDNMKRIFNNITFLSRETRQIQSWEVRGCVLTPWAVVDGVGMSRATE
jgi:PmbA protein